ncbi:Peptidase family M48 [Chitinophaga eiseniae]|uniref:Peptidase family M48 n=1 Tax=Chitinophaga eiseniae TaxID=634771 RepID=A0A1T4N405_9BACT|nr:M48 family metalloprotease [Chitinophaga eiseniae]SJZ73983.1 Peptidase family M48 [Chitinophaga eiseniae]
MSTCRSLTLSALMLCCQSIVAQTKPIYNYKDLSHAYYERQKDSLKKTWTCPAVYKDKETQKKYRDIWNERTDFVTEAIDNDGYLYEAEIQTYLDGIVRQIAAANPKLIPQPPMLLIDRNTSVNAYATGGNLLAVNIGLLAFSRTREELALVLAHEMAHNALQHPENGMKKRAEWFSSEEYKQSLNAVLDSRYERLTRLKKVFEGYSFDRSKHQRYHEGDADSLAIVLLKNSHIGIDPTMFVRLDSADIQYRQPLKKHLRDYFSAYQLQVEDSWMVKRTRGLSAKAYNFNNTSAGLADSLKTHPDCQDRYAKTRHEQTNTPLTPIPATLRNKAMKMMIWSIYCNGNMTAALYRIFLEKDQGNNDPWYDFMFSNVMSGLYYADQKLNRFNAIAVKPKEYISNSYYELETMFEQMPREKLEAFHHSLQQAPFLSSMTPAEQGFRSLVHTLVSNASDNDKQKAAAKSFTASYPDSPYCEFATPFSKK